VSATSSEWRAPVDLAESGVRGCSGAFVTALMSPIRAPVLLLLGLLVAGASLAAGMCWWCSVLMRGSGASQQVLAGEARGRCTSAGAEAWPRLTIPVQGSRARGELRLEARRRGHSLCFLKPGPETLSGSRSHASACRGRSDVQPAGSAPPGSRQGGHLI